MNADPAPATPGGTEGTQQRSGSLRMRLRSGTRETHEDLDGRFEALGRDGATADYARFLQMNEACLGVLEPLLAESGVFEHLLGRPLRPRAPEARRDLGALGLRPMVPPPFAIPRPDLPQAIGIAYVLEGSRLGGQLILKRLAKHSRLDNGEAIPTWFLESAGEAEHFRSFIDAAERAVSTERDRSLAVEAANTTFDFFIGTLRLAEAKPGSDE